MVSTIWLVTVHLEANERELAPVAFSINPKVAVKTPVCPNTAASENPVTVLVTLTVMMLLLACVALNHRPCDPLAGLLLLFVKMREELDSVVLKGMVKRFGNTCVLVAHAVLVLVFCVVK